MPANSQAFDGKITEAYWTADGGGSPVKISGPSTVINLEREATSIEAPFRDNPEFKLTGSIDQSGSMDFLDWVGGTPIDQIDIGDKGTLDIYVEGNVVGKRKWTAAAQITSKPYSSEINAAAGGTLGWDYTSAIVESTVSA